MNLSVPTSFNIFFYYPLGMAFVVTTICLGTNLYGYKFPNKLTVKNRRPKKYIIYSIYLNFVTLIIEIYALLYSIMNYNQLLLTQTETEGHIWFPFLALAMIVIIPNLILEIMYHLYWKQDFLKSQQEGE